MNKKSAIAILTYNRLPALEKMLQGIDQHCPGYPCAIFEDAGQADGTRQWLRMSMPPDQLRNRDRPDLMAWEYEISFVRQAFIGHRNLGVAANSNRALRWFMGETDADHLCLCNDDLEVLGDFAAFYHQAHEDLGSGLYCFNDFWESPTHRWIIARSRGYRVRVFQRMTGIMLSVTRAAIAKAGYFDTRFAKFGEEHCDWTNRLRFCGQIKLDGLDQVCLDVEPTLPDGNPAPAVLRHQNIPSSVTGAERAREDKLAEQRMHEASDRYKTEPHYRPFSLVWPGRMGGQSGNGIQMEEAPGYKIVTAT